MSFAINTNIASLQAQEYLRVNSEFQGKTINRVTSGLRIISSGDDAAGLAIANTFRSDQAVLSQGIRNANDGLSQLQIADGGINNISKLLDRARTLATQSASGTFTGDRGVLNSEFSSVVAEIDRQSQAIGLNQGGTFAKSLSVFIGGGKGDGAAAIDNGSVALDLSNSTVDAKSLGLSGFRSVNTTGTDIGNSANAVNVDTIINLAGNTATEAVNGSTVFNFFGQGFSDSTGAGKIGVSVNLSSVTDADTLVTAVNAGIQAAGIAGSPEATAFANANVSASLVTNTDGTKHLAFSSSTTAFQVQAGDNVSSALLGNTVGSTSAGKSVFATTVATGVAATTAAAGAETVQLHVSLNGVATNYTVALATTDTTAALILTKVQAGLGASSGVTASLDGSSNLIFTADDGATDLKVSTAGDTANYLGLGTFRAATGTSGAYNYTTTTGAGFVAATATQNFEVSINGGPVVTIGPVVSGATITTAIDALNVALQASSTARASGLVADNNGGQIRITSSNGDNFRLNSVGGLATTFGFAAGVTAGVSGTATALSGNFVVAPGSEATGISQSSLLSFSGIGAIGVSQSISLNSPDASGVDHSTTIVLTSTNASSLDAAVDAINTKLQQTNDTTLQKIVAVKEYNATTNTEGIRFISAVPAFKVSLGTTGAGNATAAFTVGISDGAQAVGSQQGVLVSSAANGTGATADISNQASAQSAVTALASAVSTLGRAQAVVGRGQNQFGYAINLASSQVSNLASAESRIRDADLASEAASLTKASILLQAGIAALAQANSAPQAVLALLRG